MKKASTIVVLALLVFACSRKTVNTAQTSTPDPVVNTAATTTDPAHATLVEQGKGIYTTKCSKCHATKDVTAYTTTRWDNILKNMIPKAKLNEAEAEQVTAYVMENAKK